MLSPRISVIVAIDTEGNCYMSLCQINTDHNVMLMFLTRLAILLTSERPGWRSDTVVLLDGASYHKQPDLRESVLSMGINVVISAPYSFTAASIEYWITYFK